MHVVWEIDQLLCTVISSLSNRTVLFSRTVVATAGLDFGRLEKLSLEAQFLFCLELLALVLRVAGLRSSNCSFALV